jgi:hypothetical protein
MEKETIPMKRLVVPLAILSILMFACNISSTPTPAVATITPAATTLPTASGTPTATEPPQATATSAPKTNVTCYELALFLDPALASGFNCQSVAEVAGDPNAPGSPVNPKYTEVTLTGYTLSGRFFTAHIDVYPVQRFSELLPDVIPPKVAALQALIGGGPTSDKGLPFLPNFNAAQELSVLYRVIPFGSGNGTRYLTQYSQYFDPINNYELFYTFQGLSVDGKYWISAILPISNPLLPSDGKNPPNGQSGEDFNNGFTTYIAALTTQLNGQPPENYSPTIPMLDALIGSISIH